MTYHVVNGGPGDQCPHDALGLLGVCGMHFPDAMRAWRAAAFEKLEVRCAARFKVVRDPEAHFGVALATLDDSLLPEIARALRAQFPDRAEAMLAELERRLLE